MLHLVQKGSRVFGRYHGGSIVRGCLVGHVMGDTLSFRYSQSERAGGIHGGRSTCVLETLPDGRVRIHEHFAWRTRAGTGVNVFEQVAGVPAPARSPASKPQ